MTQEYLCCFRWIISQAKKEDTDENISKYNGKQLGWRRMTQSFTYENSRRAMIRSPKICQESDRSDDKFCW